jgi:hypothetical protein
MRQRIVRRIAGALVLVFAATALLSAQSETVYVTKTGAKYHRAGCPSLRSSSIPMTLVKAAALYGPCKNCRPPVLGTAATPAPAVPATTASPRAAPAERAVASGRCQAITKKGTQCLRKAKAGSSYCWQHGGL